MVPTVSRRVALPGRVASSGIHIHVTAHIGDTLGAWWACAATPVRMIGNNFGPYMPWRDVWETGTLFRSACASCMPRHAKLNNIVGKQQLRAVPCGLRISEHTQLAILLTDWAWRLPSECGVCRGIRKPTLRLLGGPESFRPTRTRFSRTRESGATVQSERSADMRISISRVFVWNSRDIEKKV